MADSSDEHLMQRALALAQTGADGPAIGCVVVLGGHVVGEGTHVVHGGYDPAAHAEVAALRRAGDTLRSAEIPGAVLYSTLQPCGLCMLAGVWAKIGRVVYGAGRADVPSRYFQGRDPQAEESLHGLYGQTLAVEGGVLRAACAALYQAADTDSSAREQASQ